MMMVVCLLDGCALRFWHRPGRVSVVLSASPLWSPFCRPHLRSRHRLSWRPGRDRRLWFCRVGSYTNISFFSTSTRQDSADLRYRASRLRSALDSVQRVVSRTREELQSRLQGKETSAPPTAVAQAPPSGLVQEQRVTEAAPPTLPQAPPSTTGTRTQEQRVTNAAPPTLPQAPPSTTAKRTQEQKVIEAAPPTLPQAPPSTTVTRSQEQKVTEAAPPTIPQAPPSTLVAVTNIREQKECRVTHQTPPYTPVAKAGKIKEQTECGVKDAATPTQAPPTKQTTPLFHPGSLGVRLGETYDHLSHHINSYFSSFSKPEQSRSPSEASFSLGKGLGSYLSYSAIVGSYLSPLVPRFRTEAKSVTAKADGAVPEEEKLKETDENEEQRVMEDRARRLLLQREKIIARVSVDNRTRALVQALQRASDVRLYTRRVEELSLHLLEFPESRSVAVKEQVIPCLLRLRQAGDVSLQAALREALALVGFIEPVKKRGVRILSIDGGGTRGLLALQTLHRLQELSGKPVHQLFDFICGVSTGSILAFLLAVFQIPLRDCEDLYRKLSSDVFKQNVIVGTVKMSWSHAFYDTEIWEKLLKEKMGFDLLIQTTRSPHCPKVAAVSTVVNRGPPVKAYVFRNYNLPAGVRSHYDGSCRHKLWEAIRASSAAPGYFQEFQLGQHLHQDGGMLINNPTALAIHECQCLWPDVPLQCVVSLGTGRFESPGRTTVSYTSLKTKLNNVISSATDTEEVHTMLDALLPPNTYFRFNPFMSEDVALDESRDEKLSQMQSEGLQYLERNQEKLRRAVRELNRDKTHTQKMRDWMKITALTVRL